MGKRIGDPADPLLVSVRSGAKFSMPGMMDTVLNLGLNDESVEGLAKQTDDERFAYDSYRRFIAMYGRIVLGIDGEEFDRLLDTAKEMGRRHRRRRDRRRNALRDLVRARTRTSSCASTPGRPFPQDPADQLRGAIEAVFRSWNGPAGHRLPQPRAHPHDLGTAVNVQTMVFGNRDDNSGTGVGFTRDPATGEKGAYGDFLVNAQGEDVVAGIRNTEPLSALNDRFPKIYKELIGIFDRLEKHYRDMCDTEFTIEQGKLWMLQTRVGKRTGAAALRMAVDMTKGRKWQISHDEAVQRVTAEHLDQVLHPQFADKPTSRCSPRAWRLAGRRRRQGLLHRRRRRRRRRPRREGRPRAQRDVARGRARHDGGRGHPHRARRPREPRRRGGPRLGQAGRGGAPSTSRSTASRSPSATSRSTRATSSPSTAPPARSCSARSSCPPAEPPPEFHIILRWADEIRKGKLGVRANADNGPDAANARQFGAEGIGLCRTEHMFLGEDRLPIVRRMILADTPEEEAAALEELRVAQKADFIEILEAMDGLPVTVRLLDPPLHEFLPSHRGAAIKQATVGLTRRGGEAASRRPRQWHEFNPMLGTRGVRLGVVKPGLYAMQVRALMEAAAERVEGRGASRSSRS